MKLFSIDNAADRAALIAALQTYGITAAEHDEGGNLVSVSASLSNTCTVSISASAVSDSLVVMDTDDDAPEFIKDSCEFGDDAATTALRFYSLYNSASYDLLTHNTGDEDEDEEEGDDEPGGDDLTTSDDRTFYQYGKRVLTIGEDEDQAKALRAFMDKQQFWPSAFSISDHGNAQRIDLAV